MEPILRDTSQSIMEIAHELNFPDDKHFSRYFHWERGLSPNEYRKKILFVTPFLSWITL